MSEPEQPPRWSLVRPWAVSASAPAASVAACAPHPAQADGEEAQHHKRARERLDRDDAAQAKKQRSERGSGGSDHFAPMDAEPTATDDEDDDNADQESRKTPELPGAALPGRSGSQRLSPTAVAVCSFSASADAAVPDTTRLLAPLAAISGHEHGEKGRRCSSGDGLQASGAPAATAGAHVPTKVEAASGEAFPHDQGAGPAEASWDTLNATQVHTHKNREGGTAPGRQRDSIR